MTTSLSPDRLRTALTAELRAAANELELGRTSPADTADTMWALSDTAYDAGADDVAEGVQVLADEVLTLRTDEVVAKLRELATGSEA